MTYWSPAGLVPAFSQATLWFCGPQHLADTGTRLPLAQHPLQQAPSQELQVWHREQRLGISSLGTQNWALNAAKSSGRVSGGFPRVEPKQLARAEIRKEGHSPTDNCTTARQTAEPKSEPLPPGLCLAGRGQHRKQSQSGPER